MSYLELISKDRRELRIYTATPEECVKAHEIISLNAFLDS